MYLIHAQLRPPGVQFLPEDAAVRALALALPEERVEHVSAHPDALPLPVLGVFLLAGSLAEAESRAAALCRRLVERHPALAGWRLSGAEAPLLAPLGHGLLGPAVGPSTGPGRRRE
ncbi:hypothetical protein [Streptomyces sp. NPDC048623]|uniref:hypothetical protein n=1 Tax=Streptomyces sp. NPDC048623 TaxID=3155761 RepID=UPI00341394E0